MKIKNLSKKITAFLFAFVLLICMLPINVEADTTPAVIDANKNGESSLTINKRDENGDAITDKDLEYTIYKVADISQTDESPYQLEYILASGLTTPEPLTAKTKASEFDMDDVKDLDNGIVKTNTNGTGVLKFDNLAFGIYLVVESGTPADVIKGNDFLVSIPMSTSVGTDTADTEWNYDVVASPKNVIMDATIEKTIENVDLNKVEDKSWYSANYGDVIQYQVKATLPSSFEKTLYTTFTIKDTPPSVLSIDPDSIKVYVGSVGDTNLLELYDPETGEGDYKITASETGWTIELILATTKTEGKVTSKTISTKLNDGDEIYIVYDATLQSSASIDVPYKNVVEIDYEYTTIDGDEVDPEDPITPEDPEPSIITYSYTLTKTDDEDAPLPDAVFVIMDSKGNYMEYDMTDGVWTSLTGTKNTIDNAHTVTSGSDGVVTFTGLKEGTYYIVEKQAPADYSLLKDPIEVLINGDTTGTTNTSTGIFTPKSRINVVNSLANSWVLPSTGEFGIYLFTIGGVILIAAAIILLSKNKKKNNA